MAAMIAANRLLDDLDFAGKLVQLALRLIHLSQQVPQADGDRLLEYGLQTCLFLVTRRYDGSTTHDRPDFAQR